MNKFKVGDVVSPNVDYFWVQDWQESEVVGFDALGTRVKNKDGIEGHIALEWQWDVVEPKKEDEMPKIEVGSIWKSKDSGSLVKFHGIHTNGRPILEVVGGTNSLMTTGNVFCFGPDVEFLDIYLPHVEPKTITRWTYVYDEYGEVFMSYSLYDTEDEATSAVSRDTYGRGTLIKTVKVEYTEE